MVDLDAVLEQLRQVRKRAEGELKQLHKVIAELSKPHGRSHGGKKHQLSTAGRERIAAAQRVRWEQARARTNRPAH